MIQATIPFIVLVAACQSGGDQADSAGAMAGNDAAIKPALESITSQDILKHIQRLASDGFEGRAPGTRGEDSAVNYISSEFKRLGLKPGNPDGTYIQPVPLVGFTAKVTASMNVKGKAMPFAGPADFVADTRRVVPAVDIDNSDVVFVGYGVDAPEYKWDDYKGMDMTGKTLLMLVNDPQIPDPADASKLDTAMFKGKAMTYYGRWTYKFEEAGAKKAAAVLVIHETGPAGYPWDVPANGWGTEAFDIKPANGNMDHVAVQGWVRDEFVKKLFAASGQDFAKLKQAGSEP